MMVHGAVAGASQSQLLLLAALTFPGAGLLPQVRGAQLNAGGTLRYVANTHPFVGSQKLDGMERLG